MSHISKRGTSFEGGIDLAWMHNIILQEAYPKYFYHVGCAYNTLMMPNSGLIL